MLQLSQWFEIVYGAARRGLGETKRQEMSNSTVEPTFPSASQVAGHQVTERLARIANRVARKRARGGEIPPYPVVGRSTFAPEDWTSYLDGPRIVEETVLPGGTVQTVFMDTLADAKARVASTPAPAAPPVPNADFDALFWKPPAPRLPHPDPWERLN